MITYASHVEKLSESWWRKGPILSCSIVPTVRNHILPTTTKSAKYTSTYYKRKEVNKNQRPQIVRPTHLWNLDYHMPMPLKAQHPKIMNSLALIRLVKLSIIKIISGTLQKMEPDHQHDLIYDDKTSHNEYSLRH